jgi:hypothetical protein
VEEARQYSAVIIDYVLIFGPGLLGLCFLVFLVGRLRRIVDGEIWSAGGRIIRRQQQPSWYWFYVGVYLVVSAISILMLLWGALWILYVWEYQR